MQEKRKIRWGLLGAGAILDRWMKGARQFDDMEVVAVASRTKESAEKAAAKYGIPEAVTYDELLAREDIDVVYVPVPHTAHKELAIRAMNAGKSVLCEKPGAVCATDFEEMVECAKKNNVFFMEAVWTRFFPVIEKIKECIASGAIGDIRVIQSSFCFRVGPDYVGRLTDPMQAGGALLDVGVYNLHFMHMILGKDPVCLKGTAAINTPDLAQEIDETSSYVALYDKGEVAVMTSSIAIDAPDTAYIYGTKGSIIVPQFWKPSSAQLVLADRTEDIPAPVPQKVEGVVDEGYQFEIAYVNDCLRAGIKESDMVSWNDSITVLKQCDELRRQWGLKYPFE